MTREILSIGSILAIALILAYISFTREPSTAMGGSVVIADISKEDVQKVAWKKGDTNIEIDSYTDAQGNWLKVSSYFERDASRDDGEDKVHESRAFTGGDAAKKLIDVLAPLIATRDLGILSREKLEALGFLDAAGTIRIDTSKGTYDFEIGDRTYGGTDQYLRDPTKGNVFLVRSAPFRPIEQPARIGLMMQRLLDVDRSEIRDLDIRDFDGRHFVLIHQEREAERGRSYFALGSNPEERDPDIDAWVGKLLALSVMDFVSEKNTDPNLEIILRVSLGIDATDRRVYLEILQLRDEEGKHQWYGRSDHTRGLVELAQKPVQALIDDLHQTLE